MVEKVVREEEMVEKARGLVQGLGLGLALALGLPLLFPPFFSSSSSSSFSDIPPFLLSLRLPPYGNWARGGPCFYTRRSNGMDAKSCSRHNLF